MGCALVLALACPAWAGLLQQGLKEYAGACGLERVDATRVGAEEFEARFRRPGRPALVVGLSANRESGFLADVEPGALLRDWGGTPVVLASANTHSYEKRHATLAEYVATLDVPVAADAPGSDTWYLFGDLDPETWRPLTERYRPPPYVPPGASVALAFGLGAPGSGVPFHVHGPGFAEALVGTRRWFLTPPDRKPAFDPERSTLAWLGSTDLAGVPGLIDCVVRPGEAVFFPPHWWHATLNLEPAVFMSAFVNYPPDEDEGEGEEAGQQALRDRLPYAARFAAATR